jgi:hypothetical protein
VAEIIAAAALMILAVYKASKRWKWLGRKLLVIVEVQEGIETVDK